MRLLKCISMNQCVTNSNGTNKFFREKCPEIGITRVKINLDSLHTFDVNFLDDKLAS